MSNYNSFADEAAKMEGFIIAALTDEFIVDTWPMTNSTLEGKEDKLIEARVFNKDREVKIFRSDVGKPFSEVRVLDDNKLPDGLDSFSEEQFLDIDTKRSPHGKAVVRTTGGGRFFLPIDNPSDARIKIKYYIKPDAESGMAQVIDWRIEGFREV